MDLTTLLADLARPKAYPFPVETVTVHQTHISVVFLAGDFAYKIKKPVRFDFLDFRTLDQRRYFCDEEVRLNRRLAADVYLDVVPVTVAAAGLRFGGEGPAVEWAVRMRRLPPEATLLERVRQSSVTPALMAALARRVADFHHQARRDAFTANFGRFEVVARNTRENLEVSSALVGRTISPTVRDRLRERTEQTLQQLRPRIEARAARGLPCDTHGDLHLDHVYHFPERPAGQDLFIVDCIEFNERFRYTDPVADVAFLVMDLRFVGRADLAQTCADAYFAASGDDEGRALLPFYTAYRAAVRGKVEGLELAEAEVPEAAKQAALTRARGYWLLALGQLAPPAERPALLLVGGLPGSGKSTLARHLAEQAGFTVLRSDAVRKELAAAAGVAGAARYTDDWNERTYEACRQRAESLLFEGRRVLIDATFRQERHRQAFAALAQRWCVPVLFLVCRVAPEVSRQRLQQRQGDVSDADWEVYQRTVGQWQDVVATSGLPTCEIHAEEAEESVARQALGALEERGLHERGFRRE